MAKLRVLLADDHDGIRESLKRRLSVSFDVVAAVADGEALLEQARRLVPDIILCDITMPVVSGLEAARQLVQELPNTKIIFVTVHTSRAYIREAFRAGARGYVVKSSSLEELEEALSAVQTGDAYVSKRLCRDGGLPDEWMASPRGQS